MLTPLETRLLRHLKDDVELWRDPDATPEAPTANLDDFGFRVATNAPSPAPQTGTRKIGQCKGELAPSPAKKGRPIEGETQIVPVSQWVISIFASQVQAWGLEKDDELRVKGRSFKVVDKGGEDSHSPLRLVYCEELS